MPTSLKILLRLIVLCLLFIIVWDYFSLSASCQEKQEKQKSPYRGIFTPREEKERSLLEESLQLFPEGVLPMEGVIDTIQYIVGPGDILLISLWGDVEGRFPCMVFPQGNVIIPTMGSIPVNNLSLASVDEIIKKEVKKLYPTSEVTVSLYQIRKFVIHLTGEISQRGSFTATPIDRITSAIKMAGGVTNWANMREIQVTHRNSITEKFDLFEYEREGNLARNPLLQGGDVIYVPRLQLSKGRVMVEGNIDNPGYYQFYQGESLSEFLRRINLKKETTDWEHAYIERGTASKDLQRLVIPLDMTESNSSQLNANGYDLQDGDRIFLPKKIDQVFVHGAVRSPGSYPYSVNLKAVDYVGIAGRTENSSGQKNIQVIRRGDGSVVYGGNTIVERGDIIVVPLKKSASLLEYLQFVAPVTSLIITAAAVGIIK